MKTVLIIALAAIFAISAADLISESLASHHKWRSVVGVPDLVWNTTLARNAQKWADTIARNGRSTHSQDRVNTGENIAWGTVADNPIDVLVGLWGAESDYFVVGKPYPKCTSRYESDVWHYTQLVWEKTTQVGCGMGYSNGRGWYVCQYYPRGNMIGQSVLSGNPTTYRPSENDEPETPVVTEPETPVTEPVEPETPVVTEPVTPVVTEPVTPVVTEPVTPTSSDPFIAESLAAHHSWRSKVGVPDLVWNTTLANNAKKWADTIARNGRSSHSQDRVNTGENISYGTTNTNTITDFVGLWGAEGKYFVAGRPYPKCTSRSESDVWHYTQLVWRKTTQVGCGMGYSNGRSWYVCQYYPRGNMIGQTVF